MHKESLTQTTKSMKINIKKPNLVGYAMLLPMMLLWACNGGFKTSDKGLVYKFTQGEAPLLQRVVCFQQRLDLLPVLHPKMSVSQGLNDGHCLSKVED